MNNSKKRTKKKNINIDELKEDISENADDALGVEPGVGSTLGSRRRMRGFVAPMDATE